MSVRELDQAYVAGTYRRFPVTIVSGHGSVAVAEDGKEYIDMGSGIAVTTFGLSDPEWLAAVTAQAGRVQHMSNLYYTAPCAELAALLCQRTGMGKVFFSNSGAEANECAIKAARKYSAERRGADCFTILTLENSFHGRTLTTLAATGQEAFHRLFQPLTPGFVSVPANDLAAFEKAAAEHALAGILLECVQGEGGVNVLDRGYVRAVADWAKAHDVPLMVDEVQTGNGRTGTLFSYMQYGIEPEVVSTAKGLAGGLPLGATLLSPRLQDVFAPGDHGSTFGGNPVCCAAALSVLRRLDDALLAQVREKSAYVFSALQGAPGVEAVTGLGLMIGVKTVRPAAEVVRACMDRGVLCLTAKDKVRLLPALNIPMPLLQQAVETLKACAAE